MRRRKFTILNLLLVTTIVAILLAWRVSSLPTRTPERFVVHFCFTKPTEQIVSVTTWLDEPFELTTTQLGSDHPSPENVLVCKLTRERDQFDFYVQGSLNLGGTAFSNPYAKLDKPFSIPAKTPNAVIITRMMDDYTLEHQIDRIVSVPTERTEFVRQIARKYLSSKSTKTSPATTAVSGDGEPTK